MMEQEDKAALNTAPLTTGLGSNPSTPTILRFGPYQNNTGHWFYVDYEQGSGRKGKRRSVLVHREIVERSLGRKLLLNEVVHHKDGNPSNNYISNLEIKESKQHAVDHNPKRPVRLVCIGCGASFERSPSKERHNRKQNKIGPFCGKSCGARWSRQKQIERGQINLRA